MSLIQDYHAEHLRRRERIAAKAFRKVVVSEIVPEPEAIIPVVEPEPLRVLFCKPGQVDIPSIKRLVCKYFDISLTQIVSPRREKHIVLARQIAMYLSRELRDDLSSRFIGNQFGNRDHSTVISSIRKINRLRSCDPQIAAHLDLLTAELGGCCA